MEIFLRSAPISLLLIFLSGSVVLADWADDFKINYIDKGIDQAVVTALGEGANPDQIVKAALPLRGLIKEHLVKALFCTIAQPETVKNAAVTNGISEETVDQGYQLALNECSRQMQENLNAALDSSNQFPGSNSSSNQTGNTNYASPWKFK